jgi:uncharacterized protein (DUF305 family)
MHRRLLALAAVPVVLLAACGGDDDDSTGAATVTEAPEDAASDAVAADHNDADVAFAQGMIPHHQQAIEMAQLAGTRAEDPRVLDLASRIEAAQGPEIELMQSWLDTWEVASDDTMAGMDHGGGDVSAMGGMTDAEMGSLEAATGAQFDTMFLEMMIRHHEGAVATAETEITDGQNVEAIALAEAIVAAQEAEIAEMQSILDEAA